MKRLLILFCLGTPLGLFSQSPSPTPVIRQSLRERYQELKSTAQTFKEYKVIKETVLDHEWRIISDSVIGIRKQLREEQSKTAQLEGELKNIQITLQQKEASTAKIEHAASHIDFFGMDFNKAVFIGIVIMVFVGLLVLLFLVMGRLKITFKVMKEKNELLEMITREFEDYKHKMLEKQIKLSRELQNERNKLQELKHA